VKGDWVGGLPNLKRGSDPALKALADKEEAKPEEGKAQYELANGWLALCQKERNTRTKACLQSRAEYWLARAIPGLKGLTKVHATKKLVAIRLQQGPQQIPLAEMKVRACLTGYGTLGLKGELGYEDKKVMICGARLKNCLSIHPKEKSTAWIRFDLKMRFKTLRGAVALNDTARPKAGSPLTFKVIADGGRELWTSDKVEAPRNKQTFVIDVTGVDELELQVVCPGSNANAQAVWVDPILSK
jgi:hypothetical protein